MAAEFVISNLRNGIIAKNLQDAALACLWLASKAEETPKKSKEVLCAARNLTLPVEDYLTSDDEVGAELT
jgi:hypothetical protein